MLTPDRSKNPRSLRGRLDPLIFVGRRAFGVVDDILSARLILPRAFVSGKQLGVKLLLTTVAASAAGLINVMPAQADDVAIRIMTQNVYQGTNFDELFAAQTLPEFLAAVTTTYNNILATDPAGRAAAVANEIAREQPDLVSLQEVSTLLTGNPANTVQFDYLPSLQKDLKALGQNYSVVTTLSELNAEAPSSLGFDVRLVRGDAILVRADDNATLTNIQVQHYVNNPPLQPAVGPPIPDLRGYASVDVSIGGAAFRFVTTHLNTSQPAQLAQMQELISAEVGTAFPLIMAGDFNANAEDSLDPTNTTYQAAINAGFVDAWSAANGKDPGDTCCQNQNLLNFPPTLSERVDLELLQGAIGVDEAHLIGDGDGDRLPSGLWPADHAGVIATLEIPRGSLAVPETSTWVMLLLGFAGVCLGAPMGHRRGSPLLGFGGRPGI
jgi:endonuclease/exonuclease/phosphatase family metal-dependent hydrolase